MYKIESVTINNFWHRFSASSNFNEDVNIIIGKNGTGKTTFMNILHSVLSVDIDGIIRNDFQNIEIKLKNNSSTKTIKVEVVNEYDNRLIFVRYQISRRKYEIRYFSREEMQYGFIYKRKLQEELDQVKRELSKIVSLASLSVYRLRNGENFEIRDEEGIRAISPVDFRLEQLMQQLTTYQLELSQVARDIALELQKEVLVSILYSKEDSTERSYALDFDKEKEKSNLTSAYMQLNVLDSKVRRKISFHVDTIDDAIQAIKNKDNNPQSNIDGKVDFRSLEALRKTQKIIKMSLVSEKRISEVYEPINLFIKILKEFIFDKKFEFNGGVLMINTSYGKLDYQSLSSGEKQLLILFIETLLQRSKPTVFLTDEPELSLHISWQRMIIPAIKRLNPNAQIIAATHSPEVASKYRNSIFDMEKLINA